MGSVIVKDYPDFQSAMALTRKLNDNLSIAGYQHMQNLSVASKNGLSPQGGTHKFSIDSATTNGSKMLWDDFSERGSVMTANTETV